MPDQEEMDHGMKKEAMESQAVKINSTLNSAAKKGYRLVSTVCETYGYSTMTLYIFEKN
jgi:hypothetical protein